MFFFALNDFSLLLGTHHYPWLPGNSFSLLNSWELSSFIYAWSIPATLRLESLLFVYIFELARPSTFLYLFYPFYFLEISYSLYIGYIFQGFGCGFSSGNQGFRRTRGRLPLLSLFCRRFHSSAFRFFFSLSCFVFCYLP